MSFFKISVVILSIISVFMVINMIVKANDSSQNFRYNPGLDFILNGYPGNPVDSEGRFVNDPPTVLSGFTDIIKWKFSTNPQEEEKKNENYRLPVNTGCDFLDNDSDVIVWLGHASFFIRLSGVSMLIDPVFDKVSIVPRLAGNACDISNYKNIDYLLISHNHRDHLDIPTLIELYKNNPYIHALVPLGIGKDLTGKLETIRRTEAGWYQIYDLPHNIIITFLPARHWSRRWINDANRSLWGSFMIEGNGKTIYFAGDSAYSPHFKKTGELFENIDYALMPIGAYKPRYIMQNSHVTPEESLTAFMDLNADIMIPMHYGTYDLADEPLGEPVRLLFSAANEKMVAGKIQEAVIGNPLYIKQ